jgi:predicted GNAT family N-acyltransferase
MDIAQFRLVQIDQDTQIPPFQCSEEELNGFLHDDAKRYHVDLLAVTYLLLDIHNQHTVAYYSLLADKISFDSENKKVWNQLNRRIPNRKRRKSYPALKIGRLAVDSQYANMGIGRTIVDSIMFAFTHSKRLGCRFVTVDALSSATAFYGKCGFKFFSEKDAKSQTRLMFFDLKNFSDALQTKGKTDA